MTEILKNAEQIIADLYSTEVLNEAPPRYIGVHGTTTQENAEKILREGIVTMHRSDLGRTCLAITSDPHEAAGKLLHYEHRQPLKYLVIVSHKSGLRGYQIIEEDVPELVAQAKPGHESYNQHTNRIPPRFIKGYFDIDKLQFIKNPSYDTNAEPTTLRRSEFPQVTLEELARSTKEKAASVTEDDSEWVDFK